MDYIFVVEIIVGFIILIKGADWVVDNASHLATNLGVSEFLVGLIVVSIGTSLPELVVSVYTSVEGKPGSLIFGNVMGSNLANILLVIGFTTLIFPLKIEWGIIKRDWWVNILVLFILILLLFIGNTPNWSSQSEVSLTRWGGVILLILFIGYLILIKSAFKKTEELELSEKKNGNKNSLYLLWIGLSSVLVMSGGKFVVDGSLTLAGKFGLSEGLVGFTVIAVGTSLPELATSLIAGKKGSKGIALGNILGSNIFNILWILGLSATIRVIDIPLAMNWDVLFSGFSLLLLFLLLKIGNSTFGYKKGLVLLFFYVSYLAYLFYRG